MHCFAFVIAVLFLFVELVYASQWFHPIFKEWVPLQTPLASFMYGKQGDFNITAQIYWYGIGCRNNENMFDHMDRKDVEGKIVVYRKIKSTPYEFYQSCSSEKKSVYFQDAGAIGIVYTKSGSSEIGATAYHFGADKALRDSITVPTVHTSKSEIDAVITLMGDHGYNITIMLTPDTNQYIEPVNVFLVNRLFAWCLFLPWNLINVYLAFTCFLFFNKKEGGFRWKSLPQMACLIEVCANIIRGSAMACGGHWNYSILSFEASNILLTFTSPFSLLTSILIAVFWKNTTDQAKNLSSELKIHKYLVGVAVFASIDAIFTWTTSVLRAYYYNAILLNLSSGLFEIVLSGGVGIYFIVQGRRLSNLLQTHLQGMYSLSSTSKHSRNDELQRLAGRISKWIFFSGIFSLLYLAGALCYGVYGILYTPSGWIAAFLLAHFGLNGISMTQILAFRAQMPKRKSFFQRNTSFANNAQTLPKAFTATDPNHNTKVFETLEIEEDF